ncbi:tRNA uridine-5-carboxymethylaminomethyl(34) synthesis GTPase MnmE [Sphingomonas sp. RB3P16]|uniref:tRNA uridine-5-carboxymethylaminomethyl(34) synthesis GTPase MnmE n=1 Tax=Parasphingomonas frigoris TaxID=3096163 RepID=UPI002FC7FA8C
MSEPTIFATSSGAAPAAIAIIRVSGAVAFDVARALTGSVPAPRRAVLRALRDPSSQALLDRALVLVFPAPRTATGEDLVEFHVHGGRAVVAAVEAAIAALPGTRRAEAGEFTRRALAAGVIDLTEAEGLGDLLAAETEAQRRAALHVADGGLRARIDAWTDRLVGIAARIEAQLDFSDEDDVATETMAVIAGDIAAVAGEIDALLAVPPVERLYDGVRVVLAGPPNSGKSTLLNALSGRDVAIVSAISGTTRDRIEAPVQRGGIAYLLTDTAGLTQTPGDEIERIGVGRAEAAIAGADIVLWLGDGPAPGPDHIAIHARADLPDRGVVPERAALAVSAASGVGIVALWSLLERRATAMLPVADALVTNHRQRALLLDAMHHLAAAQHDDLLLVAEEVRGGLRALDRVAGRADTEAVLDAIFSRFCIGK